MFSSKEGFSSGKKKSFVDHLFDVKRLLLLYWGGGGGGVRGGGCHSKITVILKLSIRLKGRLPLFH